MNRTGLERSHELFLMHYPKMGMEERREIRRCPGQGSWFWGRMQIKASAFRTKRETADSHKQTRFQNYISNKIKCLGSNLLEYSFLYALLNNSIGSPDYIKSNNMTISE
jgi:hypothetical protein